MSVAFMRRAMRAMPMLEENFRISLRLPLAIWWESVMILPPMPKGLVSNTSFQSVTPCCSAEIAMMGFTVEPGS